MDGIESMMHLERIRIDEQNGKYERDPRDYKSEMNASDAKMFTLDVKMFAIKNWGRRNSMEITLEHSPCLRSK